MHGIVKVCSCILNHSSLLKDAATTLNLSHILSTSYKSRNDLLLQHTEFENEEFAADYDDCGAGGADDGDGGDSNRS
jgi:hypothetical protein